MTPDNPAAEVTPEVRAQWREWATERPRLWTQAVLRLLDALDAAERRLAAARALADEWATEGPSLVEHAHGGRDVHEGSTLERCAAHLRAALGDADGGEGRG